MNIVVKRDCVVSEWSLWSSPNNNGASERTRTVEITPLHGGKACPPLQQTKQGISNFFLNDGNIYIWNLVI